MKNFFEKNNISLNLIKIVNIGYIETIIFILGIFLGDITDKLFGKFDEEKENKKILLLVFFELFIQLWFIGIVIVIVRKLIIYIPSPLNNLFGFRHSEVYELRDIPIFIVIYLHFQKSYKQKLEYTYSRISNLTGNTPMYRIFL